MVTNYLVDFHPVGALLHFMASANPERMGLLNILLLSDVPMRPSAFTTMMVATAANEWRIVCGY
jgi:hypothetical protein